MAIAFDAASIANSTAVSSITLSHTCTGTNLVLVAFGFVNQSRTVNSITYNGTSMTAAQNILSATDTIKSYYLINPSTGANNAVVTFSASASGSCLALESITGAKQSAQPDASTTETASATPKSTEITIAETGSWVVIAGRDSSSGGIAPSTNCTDRGLSQVQLGVFDSGAGQSSGVFTMVTTSPSTMFTNIISIAPAASSGPANMKTYDGLASASVKTIDGLAIASVKTFNGLT